MIRPTHIIAGLLLAIFAFATPSAQAHVFFKKYLSEQMPTKKFNCNVCHVNGQDKKVKNSYGQLFIKVMNKPNMTKEWKSKSGDAKKTYQKEVMLPAFEKAYKKISKMTFADLLKNDLIDGVKSANEPADPKETDTRTKAPKGDAKLD